MCHTHLKKESQQFHRKIRYQAYFLQTSRKYVKKGEIWKSSGHGPVELENVV